GLTTGTQGVTINPGQIHSLNFLTAPNLLTAGTTSQVYTFQTVDIYGNASVVPAGDGGNPFVVFDLTSTSSGTIRFGSPTNSGFYSVGAGSATVNIGLSSGTFYLVDTLAGSHQVRVGPHQPWPWTSVTSNYTVAPAPATILRFITPSRYLVAGTTLQY